MSKKVTRQDLYQLTQNERLIRAFESLLSRSFDERFVTSSMTGGTTAAPTVPAAVTPQYTISESGRVTCESAAPLPTQCTFDLRLTGAPGDAVTVAAVVDGTDTMRTKQGVFDAAGAYSVELSALAVLKAPSYVECTVTTAGTVVTTDFYVSVVAL